jgi:hypothetical protein
MRHIKTRTYNLMIKCYEKVKIIGEQTEIGRS